jgi:hypothetical protein
MGGIIEYNKVISGSLVLGMDFTPRDSGRLV